MEGDPGWPARETKGEQNVRAISYQGGMVGAGEAGLSCSYHPQLPSMGPSPALTTTHTHTPAEFQEPEVTLHWKAGVQLWGSVHRSSLCPGVGASRTSCPLREEDTGEDLHGGFLDFHPKNIYHSTASSQVPILNPHKLTLECLPTHPRPRMPLATLKSARQPGSLSLSLPSRILDSTQARLGERRQCLLSEAQ